MGWSTSLLFYLAPHFAVLPTFSVYPAVVRDKVFPPHVPGNPCAFFYVFAPSRSPGVPNLNLGTFPAACLTTPPTLRPDRFFPVHSLFFRFYRISLLRPRSSITPSRVIARLPPPSFLKPQCFFPPVLSLTFYHKCHQRPDRHSLPPALRLNRLLFSPFEVGVFAAFP